MSRRRFLLVALLFAGSGAAALIYQIVWFQLLGLVIGASAVSLGVVLATFMGGLCLGSVLAPRWIARRRDPLRVFALLELSIGVIGLAVLYGLPMLGGVYAAWAGAGVSGMVLRGLVAGLCLLPPTVLMGATLPIVARWVETSPRGLTRVGFLYAANIAGAVGGCILAAFYLLRVHDVAVATFAAAALNAAVAAAAAALARAAAPAQARAGAAVGARTGAGAKSGVAIAAPRRAWPIYAAIGLSGMTALAAEVIWTRHLALLFGATIYTFALVLSVFLAGLGLGSGLGAFAARRIPAYAGLAVCQWLLCGGLVWAAYALARALPYWPLDVTLPAAPIVMLQLDWVRAAWAILPAALLWGASFPLALAAAGREAARADRIVGGVYAANTIGAIAGALGASFVLVAWLGTQVTQQILVLAAAGAGLLAFAAAGTQAQAPGTPAQTLGTPARAPGAPRRAFAAGRRRAALAAGATVIAITGALVLAAAVPGVPRELVAYGRFLPTRGPGANVIYVGEGLTSSVAVSRENDGVLTYHNAGKAQASTYPQDMRLQRMLGHLTTLAADGRESFLVVGLGAGITAGAVATDPGVERVVVAEIEPLAVHVASRYFGAYNAGVTENRKVSIRIDDGRHYLATTLETFDGITSDPLDPWVKGSAALYTREFWELARSRLRPGGVVTAFIQLYETTEEAVKSEVATFFEVFPNGALFANTVQGMGYDAVLLGRAGDAPIDVDRVHARLQSASLAPVARSLAEVGFHSAADLLGTYAGGAADLSRWLEGAVINTDRNLRLQYLAGQGLNLYRADEILTSMTADGTAFPAAAFSGSPALLEQLRRRIRARQGDF